MAPEKPVLDYEVFFCGFVFLFCSGLFVGFFFPHGNSLSIEGVTLMLVRISILATDNTGVSECLFPS